MNIPAAIKKLDEIWRVIDKPDYPEMSEDIVVFRDLRKILIALAEPSECKCSEMKQLESFGTWLRELEVRLSALEDRYYALIPTSYTKGVEERLSRVEEDITRVGDRLSDHLIDLHSELTDDSRIENLEDSKEHLIILLRKLNELVLDHINHSERLSRLEEQVKILKDHSHKHKDESDCVYPYNPDYKPSSESYYNTAKMKFVKPVTDEKPDERVEELAKVFHSIYQAEAERQGDKRHPDDYADLPEGTKNFDRVLAKYVLLNFSDMRAKNAKPSDTKHHCCGLSGCDIPYHIKDEDGICMGEREKCHCPTCEPKDTIQIDRKIAEEWLSKLTSVVTTELRDEIRKALKE